MSRSASEISWRRDPGAGSRVRFTWRAMSNSGSSTQIGRPRPNGMCSTRRRKRGMSDSRDSDEVPHVVEPEAAVGPVERLALEHRDRAHVHRRLGPLEVQEGLVERAEPVVTREAGTSHGPDRTPG